MSFDSETCAQFVAIADQLQLERIRTKINDGARETWLIYTPLYSFFTYLASNTEDSTNIQCLLLKLFKSTLVHFEQHYAQ